MMKKNLHLALFPLLQLAAMLGLLAFPVLSIYWLVLFGTAVFFLCWNLHVSIHNLVHHPPKNKVLRFLYLLFATILIGLPFQYYQLLHRMHHLYNNQIGDYTSTWKKQVNEMRPRGFIAYCLFWFVPRVPLHQQIKEAKQSGLLRPKESRQLLFELLFLALFYGILIYFQIILAICYFLLIYLGWVLISAQNYGQHLPKMDAHHTTSVHRKWYNLLTLNNGLHAEHHAHPQVPYLDLKPNPQVEPISRAHLFAGFASKWRVSFILVVLLVLGALTALPKLNMTGSLDGFSAGKDAVFVDARAYDALFGQSKFRYYFSVTPNDGADLAFMNSCAAFEVDVRALSAQVELLSNVSQLRRFARSRLFKKDRPAAELLASAAAHPQLGKLISKDQKSFLLIVDFNGKKIPLEKLEALQKKQRPHLKPIRSFGMQGLEAAINRSMQEDIVKITGLIFLLFGLYLFWRYRHWTAIVYLVSNMSLAILATVCLFPIFGYQMTVVSILALPIVLVLSLSDAIHLLGGLSKGQNSRQTISKIRVPSLLSSVTTALAFFSFQFNEAPNMVQLGHITGTAVLLEFLISMVLAQQFLEKIKLREAEQPVIEKVSAWMQRRQKQVGWGLLGLVLIALLLLPKLRFEASTDDFFPRGEAVTEEHAYFRSQFNAQKVLHLWFEPKSPQSQLDQNYIESRLQEIKSPQLLHYEMHAAAAGKPLSASMYFTEVGAIERCYRQLKTQKFFDDTKLGLHAYSPFVVFDVVNKQVASSLFLSLLTASSAIVLLMFFLTRSPVQALYGFIPNLIPLAAVVVFFVVFDQGLNMLTALTLVVCIGLLDDDTIHVLYHKYVLKEPVAQMNAVIIHAAILLAIGFGCFVVSNFEPTRIFGGVSALVFVMGLLGELTLFQWILNRIKSKND
ncbi:MAG: hypothetical protein RL331_1765 [Bacteroidota bacterium]|jgi:predicted RND superfamily exporter protein